MLAFGAKYSVDSRHGTFQYVRSRSLITMGNETSGFAVLNLSSYTLHMGLSMAATHYYENNVNHGEIFYRWPGAVHYTVYAQTAPEISDDICAKEITKASIIGITCAGVAAAISLIALPALSVLAAESTMLAATAAGAAGAAGLASNNFMKEVFDVLNKVDAADLCAKKMGCYGGGSGTWLVLRGGLKRVHGHLTHEKLELVKEKPEYILAHGKFTSYSRAKFYTTAEAKKHRDAGHSCHKAVCNLICKQ
ncbi:hypothetical protein BSL78_20999 [Apostichopus japonicus]|uniref:Uncharacterized protein n=1 Tax=Stichopus japonicus TaxID=307972 RepID=A0A2G8K2F8_STIJA|nr:hypothetical protein BSL78_20999 [Apostichopus japonicus]